MTETTLTGKTPDIAEENIKKLMTIFPEVVTDGKIDFEKLKQLLGEYVDDNNERYNFTWNGKGRALRLSQTPSLGTLRPCKEESKNWDTTQNLYIEGDNLEVLKLLQKSYYGKIKMIYIDPPYNTGKDFVYKDDFHDSIENYKRITGQVDGNGKPISTNTEASGRYHTNWLNMMYPRLRLARNLLADDGVIFISIDDNEIANLKKICNEIFGEDNYIADVIMRSNPRGSQEPYGISREHEYLVCYAKSQQGIYSIVGLERDEDDSEFNFILENGKKARLLGLRKRGGDWRRSDRPNMFYPLYVNPNDNSVSVEKTETHFIEVLPLRPDGEESRWTWGIDTAKERISELYGKEIIRNGERTYDIYRIDPLESSHGFIKREKLKSVWLDKELNYQSARQYLRELFGSSEIFDFPKPPEMIIKLMSSLNTKDGIILDFFSGSATTAHAVMQLNAKDGGTRKFIMVQLPEATDENSEAYKSGYKNISEIGKERIRRAGEKIKEEYKDKENIENLDIGFKVFKLDTSNIRKWQPDYNNFEQYLLDYVDNFVESRTELDVVYEIMLKYGLDLTYPVDEFTIAQKKVYSIGFGMLMICLDDEITTEVAKGILTKIKELSPESSRVVFKDNGFKSDSNKTNIKEILKSGGIEEFITI